MPIESEIKFVMDFNKNTEYEIEKVADGWLNIEQSYLIKNKHGSARIRKSQNEKLINYDLNFKQKLNNQTIEIENGIEKADYEMLYKVSKNKLFKRRFFIEDFEVDFFKSKSETYFVMAELENIEEFLLPPILSDNLLYQVPKEDTRFSSKKLSNEWYAKNLLKLVRSQNVIFS